VTCYAAGRATQFNLRCAAATCRLQFWIAQHRLSPPPASAAHRIAPLISGKLYSEDLQTLIDESAVFEKEESGDKGQTTFKVMEEKGC
jgi:hypothetical protein